jgi:hypothetical protein
MLDLTRDLWPSVPVVAVESSVGAVLASEVVSTELRVDVRLCLEVERRMVLLGRVGLEFGLSDLTD